MSTNRIAAGAAIATIAGLLLGLAWTVYDWSLRAGIEQAQMDAERRLDLFDQTLEATVERFHYLPSTVGQAREIRAALLQPGNETATGEASAFLSRLNNTAGASEIFIMDLAGQIVAASNWFSSQSLVGEDRDRRPYFREALTNGSGKFYAVGFLSEVPGYFLANRVEVDGKVLGVAVAKVDLGEIEAIWWRSGELIAILDSNDIVFLSTRPDWRYRPVLTLPEAQVETLRSDERYGGRGINNEGIAVAETLWGHHPIADVAPEGTDRPSSFLVTEKWLPAHGWRMLAFTPTAAMVGSAAKTAVAAGSAATLVVLLVVLLLQHQRGVRAKLADHERLEQRVAQRTAALKAANDQLHSEVVERRRAEKERNEAQASLVQAAKLASLGQALAGVAHEISQPVAALSTYVASAKLMAARHPDVRIGETLTTMDGVLDRLASLTNHLRTFARKQPEMHHVSDLAAAIDNALSIVGHKLKDVGVTLDWEPPSAPIHVQFNPVHLEQVIINLFSNAADAMEGCAERCLTIRARNGEDQLVLVEVCDTGAGIAEENRAMLFDPFFTTKDPGRGLGLGLSISYQLIREAGGHIHLEESAPGRTVFLLALPMAPAQFERRRAS